VDVFAKDLHESLAARNLSDIVDIVFVSDHGMTDTSHPEMIYLDEILGEAYNTIEHEDGLQYHSLSRFGWVSNLVVAHFRLAIHGPTIQSFSQRHA
jgi:predicted AlkP superfamily pyrophosphatase or phosphodiesterase